MSPADVWIQNYDADSTMRYPEELADRSWDNVGLLLENVKPTSAAKEEGHPTVLVTNDLTIKVAEEAIRQKVTVIVSYREFFGLCETMEP